MREPLSRAGGLHSYTKSLAKGQEILGLRPTIIDNITAFGRFNIAQGSLDSLTSDNSESFAEYHFAYGALPFVVGGRAPWKDLPKIFHFHGPWFMEGKVQNNSFIRMHTKRQIESLVYNKFNQFVVASNYFGRVLEQQFGVSQSNIHTVYPGVDSDRFGYAPSTEEARNRLNLFQDVQTVVIVRRLEPRMGVEDAIIAISKLENIHLVIAGDGSMRQELETLSDSLGMKSRVHFLGRVSDRELPLVFQAGDLSIVPTRELEGFGIVVLESMSAGTPVIATTVGGLPEAMGPFAEKWCVDPHAPLQLAESILSFFRHGPSRTEVRLYAETRSIRSMAESVERVLGNLIT